MILQEEFRKNGYTDILKGDVASEYGINMEDIFDLDEKPEELLGIFISEQKDDLFFLLDGDSMEINSLCDGWDNRIRVFAIINKKASAIQKLRYNIVQLIVYSGDTPDKNREGNLSISRKIIIKGDMTDNGKNIVNILSNGQISVFMLAHFFASINVRNDREKMKIYFIDDLTACMDDVNMLAFMDLLKYQMSSKATMEQLFFATCDNRISNLLKYKLDGRGIEFCELLESDFE